MRFVRSATLVSSSLLIAAYAGLAALGGARLVHFGAAYLYGAAALLAAMAIGLGLRQLWARGFAILFFAATAAAYGAVVFVAGRGALSGPSSDWGGVRAAALFGIAAVALVGCAVSLTVATALLLLGRAETPPSAAAQLSAWSVGVAGVAALAWVVGYQYVYRELPVQDACLGGGSAARCETLARNERFTREERQAFARTGCERGHAGSCAFLAGALGKPPATENAGAERRLLQQQCDRGSVDTCLRYGRALLQGGGDVTAAAAVFTKACTLQPNRCSQAARAAEDGGQQALAVSLLESGCDREDPYSCRALLRSRERANVPDRDALHLKTCLLTDVNECLPLIRRGAAAVCPLICQGDTDNRRQSCDHCGRYAAEQGQRALAEAWLGRNCDAGYPLSCVTLGKYLQQAGDPRAAATWFTKSCDRQRNLTLGCSYLDQPQVSR